MNGQIIQQVDHALYLGVTISNDLSWTEHINQVTRNANQKLGYIRRNLRGAPRRCKSIAFNTLVRSGMEYACSIWDPYLKKDITALESTQRKAARWVKSRFSRKGVSVTKLSSELE